MLYLTLYLLLSHYWPYINSLLFIIFKTTIFITITYYIYYKRNFSQPPLQRKRKKIPAGSGVVPYISIN